MFVQPPTERAQSTDAQQFAPVESVTECSLGALNAEQFWSTPKVVCLRKLCAYESCVPTIKPTAYAKHSRKSRSAGVIETSRQTPLSQSSFQGSGLGTHCLGGSASSCGRCVAANASQTAGRACNSMGSQAEPCSLPTSRYFESRPTGYGLRLALSLRACLRAARNRRRKSARNSSRPMNNSPSDPCRKLPGYLRTSVVITEKDW